MFWATLQPRKKTPSPAAVADELEAVAVGLDVRLLGIVQRCLAEPVILVTRVDIANVGGHARPQAVQLEVPVAPVAGDAVCHRPHIILRFRVGDVEAGAAPIHLERLAVLRREQVLLVGEARVIRCPGERHEPDPRRQTELVEFLGGLPHPRSIGPIGSMSREVPPRPVALHAGLPAVVDLDHGEPERHKVLPGELGARRQIPLVRGPGVIPGAIDRRLRRQLDLIVLRDRVGIRFQTQAGIGEVPDQQRLGLHLPAGLEQEPAVIEPRIHNDLAVFDVREQQAAASLVRDPSRDKTGAALGIGHRQK